MSKLKELFESSLLNEETKTVLQEAWAAAEEGIRTEVEAEYATKLKESAASIQAQAIEMVNEAIAEEMTEVAEELAEARSLEVDYAQRLQTFKESYAEKTQETIAALVEETVAAEMEELKEGIELARKNEFVMSMFESFREVYEENFGSSDRNLRSELEESQKELAELKREKVLNGLLESISGEKREIAMTILESVPTEKLEAKFEYLRPALLKESAPTEEPNEPIQEGADPEKPAEPKGDVVLENAVEGEEPAGKEISDRVMDRINKSLAWAKR